MYVAVHCSAGRCPISGSGYPHAAKSSAPTVTAAPRGIGPSQCKPGEDYTRAPPSFSKCELRDGKLISSGSTGDGQPATATFIYDGAKLTGGEMYFPNSNTRSAVTDVKRQ